jgi:hypothetical protein
MRVVLRFLAVRVWRWAARRYRWAGRLLLVLGLVRRWNGRPSSRVRVRVRPDETLVVGLEGPAPRE